MQPLIDTELDEFLEAKPAPEESNPTFEKGHYENGVISIKAPFAKKIQVNSAEYGNFVDNIYSDCLPFIQNLCNGRSSCEFTVSSELCGSNLPSTQDKILLVKGEYVKEGQPTDSNPVKQDPPEESPLPSSEDITAKVEVATKKINETLNKELTINVKTGLAAIFVAAMIGFLAGKN